jgi:outer membrane protein assembly factor BamB
MMFLIPLHYLVAQSKSINPDFYLQDLHELGGMELFKAAQRCEQAKDYKSALKKYLNLAQRLPFALVKLNNKLWQGIHYYIDQRISKWPEGAFLLYRQELDKYFNQLYQEAKKQHNLEMILKAVSTYFYAGPVDEILDELANTLWERGKINHAKDLWEKLLFKYPAPQIPIALAIAKLGLLYYHSGALEKLEVLHRKFGNYQDLLKIGNRSESVGALLSRLKANLKPWVNQDPMKPSTRLWSTRFEQVKITKTDFLPQIIPAVYKGDKKDIIIINVGTGVAALEAHSGKLLWSYPDRFAQTPPALRSPDNRVYYPSAPSGSVSSHKDLYAVIYLDACPKLIAFRLKTGKVLWKTNLERKGRITLCSIPQIIGEKIYLGILTIRPGEREAYLVCFNRKDGKIAWERLLCAISFNHRAARYKLEKITPVHLVKSVADVLYCLTNIGAIAAVDNSGRILWLRRYKQERFRTYRKRYSRPPNPPIVQGGKIYILPQDSKYLYILDQDSGDILAEERMPGVKSIAGIVQKGQNSALAFIGRKSIWVLDTTIKRSIRISFEGLKTPPYPSLAHGGFIYLATKQGLKVYDPWKKDNPLLYSISWYKGSRPGSISIWRDRLILITSTLQTVLYQDPDYTVSPPIDGEVKSSSQDEVVHTLTPDQLLESIKRLLKEGKLDRAEIYLHRLQQLAKKQEYLNYQPEVKRLISLFHQRYKMLGENALKAGNIEKALEYFRKAKQYKEAAVE